METPPGTVEYVTYVHMMIPAQSAEDAVNKVRHILTSADNGHELYECSERWTVVSAAKRSAAVFDPIPASALPPAA